jgi:hypothetical protein
MPCNQYELSKQYSIDQDILNFHYKNAPHMSNKTYQEIHFSPLSSFFRDENNYSVKMTNPKIYYWYASKSGIYINNNPNNSTYSNSIVVSLIKNKDNKFIINESQITNIYVGSIYPNVDVIIDKIKRVKLLRGSQEPEGQYDLFHFEEVIESFKITLSQIIDFLKTIGITEGVIFNPLCRLPCDYISKEFPIANFRRTLSKQALLANDEYHSENPDVPLKEAEIDPEDYLGGKRRKKNNKGKKSRKDKKRKTKNVKKSKKYNKTKRMRK